MVLQRVDVMPEGLRCLPPLSAQFQIANRRSHRLDARWQAVSIEVDMLPDTAPAGDSVGFGEWRKGRGEGGIPPCTVQVEDNQICEILCHR